MNENSVAQRENLGEVNSTHLNVSVEFSLLGTAVAGATEKNENGIEFLVMPQPKDASEAYPLEGMVGELNDFFKRLTECEDFKLDPHDIFQKLKEVISDLIFEALKVQIKQVFVHLIKPKDGKTQMEYAFSIGINLTKDMMLSNSKYAKLQSLTFGIWNTENEKVLSQMGLLNISKQLAKINEKDSEKQTV